MNRSSAASSTDFGLARIVMGGQQTASLGATGAPSMIRAVSRASDMSRERLSETTHQDGTRSRVTLNRLGGEMGSAEAVGLDDRLTRKTVVERSDMAASTKSTRVAQCWSVRLQDLELAPDAKMIDMIDKTKRGMLVMRVTLMNIQGALIQFVVKIAMKQKDQGGHVVCWHAGTLRRMWSTESWWAIQNESSDRCQKPRRRGSEQTTGGHQEFFPQDWRCRGLCVDKASGKGERYVCSRYKTAEDSNVR